jgi:hypothetical protein
MPTKNVFPSSLAPTRSSHYPFLYTICKHPLSCYATGTSLNCQPPNYPPSPNSTSTSLNCNFAQTLHDMHSSLDRGLGHLGHLGHLSQWLDNMPSGCTDSSDPFSHLSHLSHIGYLNVTADAVSPRLKRLLRVVEYDRGEVGWLIGSRPYTGCLCTVSATGSRIEVQWIAQETRDSTCRL